MDGIWGPPLVFPPLLRLHPHSGASSYRRRAVQINSGWRWRWHRDREREKDLISLGWRSNTRWCPHMTHSKKNKIKMITFKPPSPCFSDDMPASRASVLLLLWSDGFQLQLVVVVVGGGKKTHRKRSFRWLYSILKMSSSWKTHLFIIKAMIGWTSGVFY